MYGVLYKLRGRDIEIITVTGSYDVAHLAGLDTDDSGEIAIFTVANRTVYVAINHIVSVSVAS